jgi:RecA-family ATPase
MNFAGHAQASGAPILSVASVLSTMPRKLAAAGNNRLAMFRRLVGELQSVPVFEPARTADRLLDIARSHGLCGSEDAERNVETIICDALRVDPIDESDLNLAREEARALGRQDEMVEAMERAHPVDSLSQFEPPAYDQIPDHADDRQREEVIDAGTALAFCPITPSSWKGKEPVKQQFLASARIPMGDLTILAGNGGSGKTEIAVQLLVYVAAGLADWLGCTIENGVALFISCEEPEEDVRDRVERICRHRSLDPHAIENLHLCFPDLDATWLASAEGRTGRITKTPLLVAVEAWIKENKPRLVVIDSIAAVFDGIAFDRRQVRAFLAILRKIAREYGAAILLLDHPSVRGMADGSGTANSVDWRNSVRSMLHLSDPDKDDVDARTLELKKSNRGRIGEKVALRWTGLTFTTEAQAAASPYRAAADREVDELFLRLLDKRNAQRRPVHAKAAKGSAPAEFALDPESGHVTADGFRAAMERLLNAQRIVVIETGSESKRRSHLERAGQ